MNNIFEWGDRKILLADARGPLLDSGTASEFISELWGANATLLALPAGRLAPGFLKLETRVAGEVIQKFNNYRLGLAIFGDIDAALANSRALRDMVLESNNGDDVWFVPDLLALKERLELRALRSAAHSLFRSNSPEAPTG